MNDIKRFLRMISQNVSYYLWIIFVFTTITFLYDYKAALIEFSLFLILIVFYLTNKYRKQSKLYKYIKKLDIKVDDEAYNALTHSAIPITIIKRDGIIMWSNEAFMKLAQANDVYKLPITDYIKNFDINSFKNEDAENEAKLVYKTTHNSRSYRVLGNIINTSSSKTNEENYYIALYWYDNTEYDILSQKHYQEAFVSCIIVIDNFDDVMQSTPVADKPMLTAAIEDNLNKLAHQTNGIIKKYEKDRFLFYIQKAQLDKLIANNFSFAESFKTIFLGNKVAPTLSVGIGTDGDNLAQNDNFAYSALDMALGRGGDQVVIKDSEQFKFYGGKTKEFEKRTRVKARVVSQAIKEMIAESQQIIIMGHKYADVDVLGSALGLYSIIKSLGKNAKILMDTYNQTVERFIEKYQTSFDDIFVSKAYANEFITPDTLLFVVDTQKCSLVEEPALLDVSKKIIVIDHHRKSTDFIQNSLLTYHEPYASSASELITEILQYVDNVKLEKAEAEAMYAGIFMDTKNFTFKTGVRTFEAASYLKRMGVDTIEVKKLFQIDLNAFVKKWAIIENASTYKGKVAIATCTKNDNDMQTIVAQAADELLNITDITSSFVVCDMGKNIIISARSFGDINVQLITEKLGGGGHMTIAGAQISDSTVEEVVDKLKTIIDEYLE
ncbi:MAG: DHH family phosphoesterase [Clostridia bacterium]|nr:DHH family phosphoesterase [Clostridia bacterium]MBO7289415.1 DHH family phosphoesterase [Clostridia bacterium]